MNVVFDVDDHLPDENVVHVLCILQGVGRFVTRGARLCLVRIVSVSRKGGEGEGGGTGRDGGGTGKGREGKQRRRRGGRERSEGERGGKREGEKSKVGKGKSRKRL